MLAQAYIISTKNKVRRITVFVLYLKKMKSILISKIRQSRIAIENTLTVNIHIKSILIFGTTIQENFESDA